MRIGGSTPTRIEHEVYVNFCQKFEIGGRRSTTLSDTSVEINHLELVGASTLRNLDELKLTVE